MSTSKIIILILTINIFLYLGGVQLFGNDILDRFVDIDLAAEEVTGYSDIAGAIPLDAAPSTNNFVSEATGSFSFFDALNVVWDFFKFMLNLVFAPIGLLVVAGFPLVVQLALGVPIGLAYIFGLLMLIRGVSA